MTDAEIIAELFGCPCNYTPIDEEMCANCDCEHLCGTPEQTDAKCWQRYFEYRRKKGAVPKDCPLHTTNNCLAVISRHKDTKRN